MDLRTKAVDGVMWSGVRKLSLNGIEFLLGIILARLLTPSEFGMIATIMIVISISEVFVNSGFRQAIIRKPVCTQVDYSTAFFFNFAVGILFSIIVFFSAGWLSVFFKDAELKPIIQVLGVGLVLNSLSFTQNAQLSRQIDFRLLTKVAVISSVSSGVIAVAMAFAGFGVWSLVAKFLLRLAISSALLWYWNKWKPSMVFSKSSFRELFGFGSKLLASGLIVKVFQNLNYFVIAKYFSSADLGYYTRAELFKNWLSGNVASTITEVGYPTLAKVQDDPARMKHVFREMFKSTGFIIIILMAGLFAISNALVISLLGEQWRPSIEILQLFCILGVIQPLNSMNINVLNVVGRSDLYLKLQIISETIAFPTIFLGIFFGIKALILGRIFCTMISFVLFNRYAARYTNYTVKEELSDIIPGILLGVVMGGAVYALEFIIDLGHWPMLIIQMLTGVLIVVFAGEFLKIKIYSMLKATTMGKIKAMRGR
jgi:teichuronic acid exporter